MRTECWDVSQRWLSTANTYVRVMKLVIIMCKALRSPLGQIPTLERRVLQSSFLQFIKEDNVSILQNCVWQNVLSLMRSTKYNE